MYCMYSGGFELWAICVHVLARTITGADVHVYHKSDIGMYRSALLG